MKQQETTQPDYLVIEEDVTRLTHCIGAYGDLMAGIDINDNLPEKETIIAIGIDLCDDRKRVYEMMTDLMRRYLTECKKDEAPISA